MKKIVILCATILALSTANAQAPKQIKWTIAAKRTSPNSAVIFYKATLSPTWHIWSQNPGDDMLIPPTWSYDDKSIKNVGQAKETGKKISKTEEGFKGKLNFYEGSVVFTQKVSLVNQKIISGSINYQICDPKSCLPPTDHKFSVTLK
ncbi:MAG: protein-disulfide reductase DsbD domain-containing protein [Chitinophagales bacterium]